LGKEHKTLTEAVPGKLIVAAAPPTRWRGYKIAGWDAGTRSPPSPRISVSKRAVYDALIASKTKGR